MTLRDKDKPIIARVMFYASLVCAVLAIVGATGQDIYLASTQWLLVGILLVCWSVFLLLEASFRLK